MNSKNRVKDFGFIYLILMIILMIALLTAISSFNINKANSITGFAVKDDNDNGKKAASNETPANEAPEEKPKPEKNKESDKPPVWKSDISQFILKGKTIIDLSAYFYDEDNDTLAYLFTTPEKVNADVDGSVVTLEPTGNNFNTTITFTATDGYKSTSKEIALVVPEKLIEINLAYKSGTQYDIDDNGIETTTGIIDMSVEGSSFNWGADETKLCTRWNTHSLDTEESTTVCYGSEKCCNFIELVPKRDKWNELFYANYGQYGATLKNIVSAQIIYVDYSLNANEPFSEIYYSNWQNLTADYYYEKIDFRNVCVETCSLSGFNLSGYKLIFEIENAVLNLDALTYTIAEALLPVKVNLSVTDSQGLAAGSYQLYKNSIAVSGESIQPDYYNIEVTPTVNAIDKLVIENANITKPLAAYIGIDNVSMEINIENVDVKKRYAVNLENLEFEKAVLTATAGANSLFKCRQWDYERELCFGSWEKIKDLAHGQQYELTLTANDPGFIEGNSNITITTVNITELTLIKGIPNITIAVNSNATIDLNDYFLNIDENTKFTYFEQEGMRILFENNAAIIAPSKDFIGTAYTYITATKGTGAVISNVFNIEVIKGYIKNETNLNETYVLFDFADGERVNITYYIGIDGEKIEVPYKKRLKEPRKFGLEFNKSDVEREFKSKSKKKEFDNKMYYQINSSEEYFKSSFNPYALERPLGYTKKVKNQIGQTEDREVKRFLSFEDIFNKESNIFNITIKEINKTVCLNGTKGSPCSKFMNITANVTIKQKREIGFELKEQGKSWIAGFLNLFDLDPTFLDDTDTNWNVGGNFSRMSVRGTGAAANLSALNTSGYYSSRIFDATAVANWTNITLVTEAPYGIEIGRAKDDINNGVLPGINTSGLIVLMHFNNESAFGENNSLFYDFSRNVNSIDNQTNNGTCNFGSNCPDHNFTDKKLGRGAVDFESDDTDAVHVNMNNIVFTDFTYSAWIKIESLATFLTIIDVDLDEQQFGVDTNGVNIFARCTATAGSVTTGVWTHIAWTVSGANYVIYKDGANIGSGSDCSASVTATNLHIGSSEAAAQAHDEVFDGLIDEVAVFNRSLSATEIRNLYLRGAYRLNLSARACDDNACAGETYANIQTNNISSGFTIPLNLSATGRYFQYNITYANQSAYGVRLNVENVSVEYYTIATGDTTKPRMNASLNNSAPQQGFVVNMTANVTDETGLSFCQFIENQSLSNGAKNFFNKTVAGTNDQCSQNYTIALAAGNVINFTVIVNDTGNNINLTTQIITVVASNTAPVIKLNNVTGANPQFAVDPVSGGSSIILISFNITDADGVATINATKAIVNLTLGTPGASQFRFNVSDTGAEFGTCYNHTQGSVMIINCTVLMNYFDNASSKWVMNVSVQDTSGAVGRNDTLTFTYNTLSSISFSNASINFSSVTLNQQDAASNPLVLNNTGNDDFDQINITAAALIGTTTASETIAATNFFANTTNAAAGKGVQLGTSPVILRELEQGTGLDNATLMHGHTSAFAPNADKGNRTLFFWVDVPASGLSSQLYNATWNLTVINLP